MTSSVELLLAPVSPARPTGEDIRYSLSFDLVRSLRRQAQTENSVARWRNVAEQLESLIRNRSKDLFLAAWLTEAWTRLHGFEGATNGLDLITELMDTFWDELYPALDNGDAPADARVGVIEWLDGPFIAVISSIPITRAPAAEYNVLQLEAPRRFGARSDGLGPSEKDVNEALRRTDRAALRAVASAADEAGRSLIRLAGVVARRFGSESATSFLSIREVLDAARQFATAGLNDASAIQPEPHPFAAAPSPAVSAAQVVPASPESEDPIRALRRRAESLRAAGDNQSALGEWQLAINSAHSGRERFMLRLWLGEFCLESGLGDVARHVLDAVCAEIEARRLDEWEDPDPLSRAWAALYLACLPSIGSDSSVAARAAYAYTRLCGVDASRAVAVRDTQPPTFASKSQ